MSPTTTGKSPKHARLVSSDMNVAILPRSPQPSSPPIVSSSRAESPSAHLITSSAIAEEPTYQHDEEVLTTTTSRALRNRTAAQLNPYSIEQARYARTLLKNGWQGAVVAGPRAVELSAEELHRKKMAHEQAPKDSLGGWLQHEESGPTTEGDSEGPLVLEETGSPFASRSESEDGDMLLERLALQKQPPPHRVEKAIHRRSLQDAGQSCLHQSAW